VLISETSGRMWWYSSGRWSEEHPARAAVAVKLRTAMDLRGYDMVVLLLGLSCEVLSVLSAKWPAGIGGFDERSWS